MKANLQAVALGAVLAIVEISMVTGFAAITARTRPNSTGRAQHCRPDRPCAVTAPASP